MREKNEEGKGGGVATGEKGRKRRRRDRVRRLVAVGRPVCKTCLCKENSELEGVGKLETFLPPLSPDCVLCVRYVTVFTSVQRLRPLTTQLRPAHSLSCVH